jgi:hypothetical protein
MSLSKEYNFDHFEMQDTVIALINAQYYTFYIDIRLSKRSSLCNEARMVQFQKIRYHLILTLLEIIKWRFELDFTKQIYCF